MIYIDVCIWNCAVLLLARNVVEVIVGGKEKSVSHWSIRSVLKGGGGACKSFAR
jgi:hypothetical protein